MPVDLKIRHERCTGFTPEQRRFEPYRTASPREPMRRRSFSPTRCTSPGGRVRQISRLMASQKLRQVPIDLKIRHERRTGSTPEERRFEPYRTASPREPLRRRTGAPNATCENLPSFVRHQSVVTNLEALHLQILSPSGMSHLPLCSARPHGHR